LNQEDLDRMLGDCQDYHNRQQANCWGKKSFFFFFFSFHIQIHLIAVEGIEPIQFHDIKNGKYDWVLAMEENAHIIRKGITTDFT
jgi:hypothetical protein